MSDVRAIALAAGAPIVAFVVLFVVILAATSDPNPAAGATGSLAGTQLRAAAGVPAAYAAAINAAGQRCADAPPPILAAQAAAESGFNPRAVSPAGAQGMAQFIPSTWAAHGVDGDGDGKADPFNPFDAIASQAAYDCALAAQVRAAIAQGRIHGDPIELMLAAYNAGFGAVLAAGGIPPYDETRGYIRRITGSALSFTDTTTTLAASGSTLGARIVAAAQRQLGVPYAWGGGSATGPTTGIAQGAGTVGFDCSGLVLYAVAQATGGQTQMPRLADDQTRVGTPITDRAQLQPGDLISFTLKGQTTAHHIGIYIGNGQMIHAPETGGVVTTTSLNTTYWQAQTWRMVRIG